jgi:hypothetical protein
MPLCFYYITQLRIRFLDQINEVTIYLTLLKSNTGIRCFHYT